MDSRKCGNCFYHDKFGDDYICDHLKNDDKEIPVVININDEACKDHEYE